MRFEDKTRVLSDTVVTREHIRRRQQGLFLTIQSNNEDVYKN